MYPTFLVHEQPPSREVTLAYHALSAVGDASDTRQFSIFSKIEALDVLENAEKTIANLIVLAVARARGYIPCGTGVGIPTLMTMARDCEFIEMKEDYMMPMEYVAAIHAYTTALRTCVTPEISSILGKWLQAITAFGCPFATTFSRSMESLERCAFRGCIESCWQITLSEMETMGDEDFIPCIRRAFEHSRDWCVPFTASMSTIIYDLATYVRRSGMDFALVGEMLEFALECGFTDIQAVGICAYESYRTHPLGRLAYTAFRCLKYIGPSERLATCYYAGIGTEIDIGAARRTMHDCECNVSDHEFGDCGVDWFATGDFDVEGSGPGYVVDGEDVGRNPPAWWVNLWK